MKDGSRPSPDDPVPGVKMVEPHQMGWLHRPELDSDRIEVWEKPNGELYAHEKSEPKLRLGVVKRWKSS